MKIVRYLNDGKEKYGIIKGNFIFNIEGSIWSDYKITDDKIILSDTNLLSPINPRKIIALGYNYKDLVGKKKKYDEPILFLKPTSSIICNGENIILNELRKTWIEVELAIVIKKSCKNVTIEEADDYILGYTIANDVTMENVLGRDHHLARSKGRDTFCPIGPHIESELDTSNLTLISKINGKIMQESNVNNRILNDFEVVSFVSKHFTLDVGDVIITGTPANAENSIIKDGDVVELFIENIGVLSNNVIFNGD